VSDDKRPRSFQRLTAAAVAIGLGIGGYGLAAAASGSGSSAAQSATTTAATTVQQMPDPGGRHGWGGQRSDETALTGDTLAKVRAAALAKLPGATIERVETDADGHAKYEAHVVKSDGTPATVYVDDQFAVVSVETR
jgi:hypothetical protein